MNDAGLATFFNALSAFAFFFGLSYYAFHLLGGLF